MSGEEVRVVVPGTVHVIRGLADGDKVVVQSHRRLSIEQAEQIQAQFLNYGIEAVILPPDLTIVTEPVAT